MCPLSPTTFPEWQSHQQVDPNFVAAASTLEIGYQVSRLRIQSGLTQSQLAKMVGTRLPSIARLENGSNIPSLSLLDRIAKALDSLIEQNFVPRV